MTIRFHTILINTILGAFIFFCAMFALLIYEHASAEPEQKPEVCRAWHGHRVECGAE